MYERVASTADVPATGCLLVDLGGVEIVIAQVGTQYFAVDAICTHGAGMLDEGGLDGFEIECPLHAGRFDVRTGEPTVPPAVDPLRRYDVMVEGDNIFLSVPGDPI